jgi:hypothetical protein
MGRDPIRGNVRVDFKALQRLDEVRLNAEPARITIEAVHDGNGHALSIQHGIGVADRSGQSRLGGPRAGPSLVGKRGFNAEPYCVGAAVVHDYRVWLAGALGREVRARRCQR